MIVVATVTEPAVPGSRLFKLFFRGIQSRNRWTGSNSELWTYSVSTLCDITSPFHILLPSIEIDARNHLGVDVALVDDALFWGGVFGSFSEILQIKALRHCYESETVVDFAQHFNQTPYTACHLFIIRPHLELLSAESNWRRQHLS